MAVSSALRLRLRAALATFPLLVPVSAAAQGYVGIYSDSTGTTSCASVPPLSSALLYVLAKPSGSTSGGVLGAEFRIVATDPEGWFFSFNAAGGVALGNALQAGVTMAFSSCHQPVNGIVQLGTLSVFNSSGDSTALLVQKHSSPSNPNYSCPLFVLCDSPVFTQACMQGSSEPPCSIAKQKSLTPETVFVAGLNSSGSGGGPIGVVATFAALASFEGHLLASPWSPNGSMLAFVGSDGLRAFRLDTPLEQPTLLVDRATGRVNSCGWSPDGAWVLCRLQTPSDGKLYSLAAVEVATGSLHWVVQRANIGSYLWAADGNIYFWDNLAGRRRQFQPPAVWSAQAAAPFPEVPQLVGVRNVVTGKLSMEAFQTQGGVTQQALATLSVINADHVIAKATFSDGRHLVWILGGEQAGTRVLSSGGSVVSPSLPVLATSVSNDGTWICGYVEEGEDDHVTGGKVYVVRPDGSDLTMVQNITQGVDAYVAPHGMYMTYLEPGTGVIRIGTLTIDE